MPNYMNNQPQTPPQPMGVPPQQPAQQPMRPPMQPPQQPPPQPQQPQQQVPPAGVGSIMNAASPEQKAQKAMEFMNAMGIPVPEGMTGQQFGGAIVEKLMKMPELIKGVDAKKISAAEKLSNAILQNMPQDADTFDWLNEIGKKIGIGELIAGDKGGAFEGHIPESIRNAPGVIGERNVNVKYKNGSPALNPDLPPAIQRQPSSDGGGGRGGKLKELARQFLGPQADIFLDPNSKKRRQAMQMLSSMGAPMPEDYMTQEYDPELLNYLRQLPGLYDQTKRHFDFGGYIEKGGTLPKDKWEYEVNAIKKEHPDWTDAQVVKELKQLGIDENMRILAEAIRGQQEEKNRYDVSRRPFEEKKDELATKKEEQFIEEKRRELGGERPLPPTTSKELSDYASSQDSLREYQRLFNSDYVGPVAGGVIGNIQETTGAGITSPQAEFYAQEAAVQNAIIKQITGAQMSEPEANRIKKQIPTRWNPPKVWAARMKQTLKNSEQMEERRKKILKATGYQVPGVSENDDPAGLFK